MSDANGLAPGQEIGPGGHVYMSDSKGRLIRFELVDEQDLLEDQLVRELHAKVEALAEQIGEMIAKGFEEIEALQGVLAETYGDKKGGAKGNLTLASYDGLKRVLVQVQDRFVYGPQLQTAKSLIDEYLTELVGESAPILQAMVLDAFSVDKAGQINRGALLRLRKYKVEDERWKRAMDAIVKAERPAGTVKYLRFHTRPTQQDKWEHISLDAAAASQTAIS